MLLSTRQLQAFVSVVQYGNFTRAADRLHITQAGLSGMIREMETQLRCRLFHRTTRKVELTEAGGYLLPYVQRALQDLDAGIEGISFIKELRHGRLRIGVTPFVGAHIIPTVLHKMSRLRPDLRIELVDAEQHIIQQLVDNGELDAAFGYLFTQTAGVQKRPLFTDPLCVVVPRGSHPECAYVDCAADWDKLKTSTLVVLNRANPLQIWINDFLSHSEAPAFNRTEVRHLSTALGLVAAGLGIALMPSSVLVSEQAHHLRAIPLRLNSPSVEHCCLKKSGIGEVDGLDQLSELFSATCKDALRKASAKPRR